MITNDIEFWLRTWGYSDTYIAMNFCIHFWNHAYEILKPFTDTLSSMIDYIYSVYAFFVVSLTLWSCGEIYQASFMTKRCILGVRGWFIILLLPLTLVAISCFEALCSRVLFIFKTVFRHFLPKNLECHPPQIPKVNCPKEKDREVLV